MRVAFATWNGRVAPVFDVTRRVLVVDSEGGRVVRESEELLDDEAPADRAARLAALGVDALVCGAISRPQEALIKAYGLTVVPFVTGDLGDVVDAWRTGTLARPAFVMPGCGGGQGHGLRGGRGWGHETRRRRQGRARRRRAMD